MAQHYWYEVLLKAQADSENLHGKRRVERAGRRRTRWRQVLANAASQAELQRLRVENLLPRVQSNFLLADGNSQGAVTRPFWSNFT